MASKSFYHRILQKIYRIMTMKWAFFYNFFVKIITLTQNLLIAWSLQCLNELSESELDSASDHSLSELELLSILCPYSGYLNFLSQN